MPFDPALTTQRDYARLALGDTSGAPILADATIDALINQFGYAEGLAQSAEGILALYAAEPSKFRDEGQGLDVAWDKRLDALKALITKARNGQIMSPLGAVTAAASGVVQLVAPDLSGMR